jgi:hypothetical protein
MAIVKSLSQAPMGLDDEMMSDEIMSEEPDIEIEIEGPERVEIGVGGLRLLSNRVKTVAKISMPTLLKRWMKMI